MRRKCLSLNMWRPWQNGCSLQWVCQVGKSSIRIDNVLTSYVRQTIVFTCLLSVLTNMCVSIPAKLLKDVAGPNAANMWNTCSLHTRPKLSNSQYYKLPSSYWRGHTITPTVNIRTDYAKLGILFEVIVTPASLFRCSHIVTCTC